jgi:hypothetical protein
LGEELTHHFPQQGEAPQGVTVRRTPIDEAQRERGEGKAPKLEDVAAHCAGEDAGVRPRRLAHSDWSSFFMIAHSKKTFAVCH